MYKTVHMPSFPKVFCVIAFGFVGCMFCFFSKSIIYMSYDPCMNVFVSLCPWNSCSSLGITTSSACTWSHLGTIQDVPEWANAWALNVHRISCQVSPWIHVQHACSVIIQSTRSVRGSHEYCNKILCGLNNHYHTQKPLKWWFCLCHGCVKTQAMKRTAIRNQLSLFIWMRFQKSIRCFFAPDILRAEPTALSHLSSTDKRK